jgi:hypothetical protein
VQAVRLSRLAVQPRPAAVQRHGGRLGRRRFHRLRRRRGLDRRRGALGRRWRRRKVDRRREVHRRRQVERRRDRVPQVEGRRAEKKVTVGCARQLFMPARRPARRGGG